MQPVEALQRVVELAQAFVGREGGPTDEEDKAIDVTRAMLAKLVPVARFRVAITIDYPAHRARKNNEWTACCTDLESLVAVIGSLGDGKHSVHIIVFEMMPDGTSVAKHMYQGFTKTKNWRAWVRSFTG